MNKNKTPLGISICWTILLGWSGVTAQEPSQIQESGQAVEIFPLTAPNSNEGINSSELPYYARHETSISESEATFNFLLLISMLEDRAQGEGDQFIRVGVGLAETSSDSLKLYAIDAVERAQQRSSELLQDLCNRTFSTRSELANAVVAMDEQHKLYVDTLTYDLTTVLSGVDQAKLSDWLDRNHKPSTTKVAFDYAAYINSADVRIDEILDRVCS